MTRALVLVLSAMAAVAPARAQSPAPAPAGVTVTATSRAKLRVAVLDLAQSAVKLQAVQQPQTPQGQPGSTTTVTIAVPPPQEFARGLTEMLTTQLVRTGRFVVLERAALQAVQTEQQLGASGQVTAETAARAGGLLGAQVIVTGDITGFTYTRSSVGGNAANLVKGLTTSVERVSAQVILDLRLIDAVTGEVIASEKGTGTASATGIAADLLRPDESWKQQVASAAGIPVSGYGQTANGQPTYSQPGAGQPAYGQPAGGAARPVSSLPQSPYGQPQPSTANDLAIGLTAQSQTPLGKATREALTKAIAGMLVSLPKVQWSARVVDVRDGEIYLNTGSDLGLQPGVELSVYEAGAPLVDPETGRSLGISERLLGTAVVSKAEPRFAIARPTGGSGFGRNNVVRLGPPPGAAK